jgi:hypothetical protein
MLPPIIFTDDEVLLTANGEIHKGVINDRIDATFIDANLSPGEHREVLNRLHRLRAQYPRMVRLPYLPSTETPQV